MPKLFDVTHWNPQPWYSTGGTRSKKFLQSHEGVYYYFKKSYKTPGRDYFFEFWSEIIATEIGASLGFNLLHYDLAIDGEEMGCLSENMIKGDGEELIEGGKYLQAEENKFNPDVKEGRELYSFELIEKSLTTFKLSGYMEKIVEIIVFDSIIGNGDRHQENWAFINQISPITAGLDEMVKALKQGRSKEWPKLIRWLSKRIFDYDRKEMKAEGKTAKLFLQKTKGFAPIYDNGSSLGRELTDEKVNSMLKNEQELNAYLNRGESEIHWENEKLNHFELIKKLLSSPYKEITERIIDRVISKFNTEGIDKIIKHIDDSVPENFARYKLPEPRKHLILKLVTLRFERLRNLRHARI